MGRHILVGLSAALLVGLSGWSPGAAQDSVFPDKNLEAAVRTQVFEKRNTEEPLNKEDATKVYVLKAKGKESKDLTGLEYCISLGEVDLSDNQVADIGPVKALENLQSLDLSGNQITDLSPLAGLTKLQYLGLSRNRIADVAPLAKLVNLNALYLAGNQIADITPLKDLQKVWSLYLGGNPLRNMSVLGGLRWVSTLDLRGCGISDVSPLKGLKELSMLFLEDNKIADLGPLVEMIREDAEGEKRFAPFLRLYLKGNPLSDMAKGRQVTALQKWGVRIDPAN